MRLPRWIPLALLGLGCASAAWAQDVTVTDPVPLRNTPVPEAMPQARHRVRFQYPEEARGSDEIGYVIVTRSLDETGASRYFQASGNEAVFERAVQSQVQNWRMEPARKGDTSVAAAYWQAVIFNPATAPLQGPDAAPRLLQVSRIEVPSRLLNGPDGSRVVQATVAVDVSGKVTAVTLPDDPEPAIAAAVRDGVLTWRFAPARQGGQAAAATVSLPVVLSARLGLLQPDGEQTSPTVVKQVAPVYPPALRWTHVVGQVTVRFEVTTEGEVDNAVVVSSNNPGFEDAALAAVRQWKFRPGLRNGKPAKTVMMVPIVFSMNGPEETEAFGVRGDAAKLPPEYQYDVPPKIRGIALPVYPDALLRAQAGGKAAVAFVVNAQGRVVSTKVVSATRPEFGLALAAAVETYQFDPALRHGRPVATVMSREEHFSFIMESMADLGRAGESETAIEADFDLAQRLDRHPEQVATPSALDHPLNPISRRPAVFPANLAGKVPHGSAVVEVIVDRDGRVRIPRIVEASDSAFGYAAVQAVASWRFDPPQAAGKPALARVQIPFTFKSE